MPEDLGDKRTVERVDTIAGHPFTKGRELQQRQNYRTTSLISHPSKIMPKVIVDRVKAKAEELLAEEQAGLRSGRSTGERILNSRVLTEKHQ